MTPEEMAEVTQELPAVARAGHSPRLLPLDKSLWPTAGAYLDLEIAPTEKNLGLATVAARRAWLAIRAQARAYCRAHRLPLQEPCGILITE